MVEFNDPIPEHIPPSFPKPKPPTRFPLLHRWRTRSSSSSDELQDPFHNGLQTPSQPQPRPRLLSITEAPSSLADAVIKSEYIDLFHSIVDHVCRYYHTIPSQQDGLRGEIASTTAGCHLPTREISQLLGDISTRAGALTLCISWVILSRCLLLKSGMSSSPGSTFLPPEIVECFQSFSCGQLIGGVQTPNHAHTNWALLARWKQITAALMHATYVTNGFSHTDLRTANVERALNDLEPLLGPYAVPGAQGRIADLRFVLQKGARLAFALFRESCVWQFDWDENKLNGVQCVEDDAVSKVAREKLWGDDGNATHLDVAKIVIWPALLRVVNDAGHQLGKGEGKLSAQVYMKQFATSSI